MKRTNLILSCGFAVTALGTVLPAGRVSRQDRPQPQPTVSEPRVTGTPGSPGATTGPDERAPAEKEKISETLRNKQYVQQPREVHHV